MLIISMLLQLLIGAVPALAEEAGELSPAEPGLVSSLVEEQVGGANENPAEDQDEEPAEDTEKAKLAEGLKVFGRPAGVIKTYSLGGDVEGTLYDNGRLVISGSGPMDDYTSSEAVPFKDEKDLIETVVVQSGVIALGSNLFYDCKNLTSITIMDSVTSIGNETFSGCTALTSVTSRLTYEYRGVCLL